MDLRERVALCFIVVSVVSTVGLGGAVAYELGTNASSTVTAGLAGGQAPPSAASQGSTAPPQTGPTAQGGGGVGGRASAPGPTNRSAGGGSTVSTAAIGVANGVITVGGVYDETGVLDATVERDTVRAYFDEVNAAGGVNGYRFQLVDCDSAYDPTRAHQCSEQLLSQNILAVVGWLSASGEQPETPFLTSHGMPIIGGLGVPSEFTDALSYPVSVDLARGAAGAGLHAADLKAIDGNRLKAPGVVLLNTNFTDQVKKYLLDALHSKGISEKDVITVDATKADYTDTVIRLRSENVDSIIAGVDPFSYARLFQAMQRQNYDVRFYGITALDKSSAEKQYGNQAFSTAESVTPVIEPVGHESDPAVAEYLGAVKRYFPNQVAALDLYSEGDWVAAKIFVEAVRRIGKQPLSRRALVDALNGIQNFQSGLTVPLSFAPGNSHDPNHCLQWIRQQGGSWTTYSGWNCF
jgi:ABC-type branched-subunit amino acid transport system substrate-binding protein